MNYVLFFVLFTAFTLVVTLLRSLLFILGDMGVWKIKTFVRCCQYKSKSWTGTDCDIAHVA